MHAGFPALRQHCPTNFRRAEGDRAERRGEGRRRADRGGLGARARDLRRDGPFLFGRFSAADAMFAPVVNRFHVYDVPAAKTTRAYMEAIMALPAWKAWIADAEAEPWRIERYEAV